MWYDCIAIAYKLLFSLFLCLKAYSFFVWPLLHNAQTKIAMVYMREQACDTGYDMIARLYQYDMVYMQLKVYIDDH